MKGGSVTAIQHTIWSLATKQPLQTDQLTDESELEKLIVDHIELLNKNWLVIGNQVRTDAGKYLDILCIDHDGDLVVVELKKDMTPREVTAQVIDYAASISKMSTEKVAQVFLDYSNQQTTLNEAFEKKFGEPLDEESVNQHVKMVIVAAQMDDGTERIIQFLRDTYRVDINILFFQVFHCGGERLLSRAWFEADAEEILPSEAGPIGTWNEEYYVSFGEGSRKWEDARKYGFISGGGGDFYSRTLKMLAPNDRIWVNIPHTGYVGAGIVTEAAKPSKEAMFRDGEKQIPMERLSLQGDYFYSADDPEKAEWVVKVDWIHSVPVSQAVHELGFFGNQNTVCRPIVARWSFTIDRLKKAWSITD